VLGTTAGGAILGAVAGHAAAGMSRHDLKELGEQLDDKYLEIPFLPEIAQRVNALPATPPPVQTRTQMPAAGQPISF
jgi:hypothetical protein